MGIVNILLCLLTQIVVLLLGKTVCDYVKTDINFPRIYTYGTFLLWGVTQLFSVPITLLKIRFSTLFIVLMIVIILICIYGIIKNGIKFKKPNISKKEMIFVAITICMVCVMMFLNFKYQHVDEDDSRFVVNAVDILDTDRLFLTNPATGEEIPGFILRESDKDVCSPFAVYIAMMSRITGITPVVFAHSVLPLMLIVLASCVWWLVGEKLIGKNIIDQSMFTIFILLMHLFGYSYLWTEVTMFMNRLWQGKSIVASIGIPALFVTLFDFYDDSKYKNLLPVFIVDMGLCLLSGNGIVMGAIIIGCFALAYSVLKKDIKLMFIIALIAIPNFMYYLLSIYI